MSNQDSRNPRVYSGSIKKTPLERMEDLVGKIVAHDSRFLIWTENTSNVLMQRTSHDLRDLLPRLKGLTIQDLREALPDFAKRRSRVTVSEEKE